MTETSLDTWDVVAAWDKESYVAGETLTGTISGGDVLTVTTVTEETVGPVTIPIVAADGAQTTVNLSAVQVSTTTVTTTPESVLIDTSVPVVDNGPSPRTWVVSEDKLSISATA